MFFDFLKLIFFLEKFSAKNLNFWVKLENRWRTYHIRCLLLWSKFHFRINEGKFCFRQLWTVCIRLGNLEINYKILKMKILTCCKSKLIKLKRRSILNRRVNTFKYSICWRTSTTIFNLQKDISNSQSTDFFNQYPYQNEFTFTPFRRTTIDVKITKIGWPFKWHLNSFPKFYFFWIFFALDFYNWSNAWF